MGKENILLLHGALGSKDQFHKLKQLLELNFIVFDMNFEGHGDRASTNEFSIDLFSDNVFAFLQDLKIDTIDIFGYSMGGYVALHLASKHPKMVDKIMTLGTKFNWTPESAAKEVKMLNPEKIEEKIPAFANHLNETHTATSWKSVMQKTAQMMLEMGDGKKLSKTQLQSIHHPVLIGIGSLDNMVTLEESQEASALLQNGKLKRIEGFKHPIAKVDMKQLADLIQNFILS